MTYRPRESVFGPPWSVRIPSYLYLATALAVAAAVVWGERSAPGSWLYHYVVTLDAGRVMSIRTLAVGLLIGSVAAVLRTGMRGVRVYSDGVESREVHNLIVPRVRRFKWPQLECIILDQKTAIAFDLWDGSRAFLPIVKDRDALAAMLEHVAAARSIPVRGGVGLDELPDVAQEA